MSALICTGTVALVNSNGHSMEVTVYRNNLDAVLSLLNRGSLAASPKAESWGSDEHRAALVHVKEHAERILREIEEMAEEGTQP